MLSRSVFLALAAFAGVFAACESSRNAEQPRVAFDQVSPILQARCLRCHADVAPAAGWRADSYLGTIGCTVAGAQVTTTRGDGAAPLLLTALDRPDHANFVTDDERAILASWIASGTPRSSGGIHNASFADPRSPLSHGAFLRAKRHAPMLDTNDADACGVCHEGAPREGRATRAEITGGAAHAPACTSCHEQPNGATACAGTCHGTKDHVYPPRDRCFFPNDRQDRAHAAHAESSASRSAGMPCKTCHPEPSLGEPVAGGTHANGYVDVWLDYAVAGREARFDQASRRCTGTCHAHGGAREAPSWSAEEAPMTCNDCHSSPPRNHYKGACTSCHREADATGTALNVKPLVLHMNGKADLGDGSGKCGACHGQGDDPWPSTGAHRAHANPMNAKPVACETCHEAPHAQQQHPEGKGAAAVRLVGLATRGGRRPVYDPSTKGCAGTYCHEGSGASIAAPKWTDGAQTCTSCHGAPPPAPHVQSTATCGGSICHEGSTTGLTITPAGRAVHVDGKIDRGL